MIVCIKKLGEVEEMELKRNLRLRNKLWDLCLTQYYLAMITKIPEAYISKFINGGMSPTEDQKRRIAEALEVEINELF
jgi:transcriptional regulator with XRE-family HTH domain